ncbi:MAG: hypothetical protein ACYSTL_05805, partial [Planctomycetota bacterium]
MRFMQFITCVLFVVLLTAGACKRETPEQPPPKTAADTSHVPEETIAKISELFSVPEGQLVTKQTLHFLNERMTKVLELGAELETQYPDADNLYAVRALMLQAAEKLVEQQRDEPSMQLLMEISERILNSPAPPEVRVRADFFLIMGELQNVEDGSATKTPDELLIQLVQKYENTPAASWGVIYALTIARELGYDSLAEKFITTLQTKFRHDPDVRMLLSQIGRDPYSGEIFTAELRRLDGTTLKLPDDLAGKMVVVDFWTSWHESCRATLPTK